MSDSATLLSVAHKAPLSMGFPSKNTGVGCYVLLQGISLTRDRTQESLVSSALQVDSFLLGHQLSK